MNLRKLHKYISLIVSLQLLLWTVSGIYFSFNKIENVRIAYGGMASTPKRGIKCEEALIGKPWNARSLRACSAMVAFDFQPISDLRASRNYRLKVAANLFDRLYQDITDPSQLTEVVRL